MPIKSKAQQRFLFATKPKMAKEWADETPNIKALPERVKSKTKSKVKTKKVTIKQKAKGKR